MLLSNSAFDELKIGGYVNFSADTLGIDSLEHCFDKQHYRRFPYNVKYRFNELGYRERPLAEYSSRPVIVIGDSFTQSLGLPFEYSYSQQLENLLGTQCLNFSLNGASNDWISRKLSIILKYFCPCAVVVHYTFSHRREKNCPDWFDDERTLCPIDAEGTAQDLLNWQTNHKLIQDLLQDIPTVYSFISDWHRGSVDYGNMIPPVTKIDLARDGFHYGIKTSRRFAENVADRINL